jgi:diguanylate cyclase
VVDQALAMIGRTRDISVAVNLSAKLLLDSSFNAALDAVLARNAGLIGRLIFEITETAAMADLASSARALARFRDAGITISMDDYGTGQSTLAYIQQLPLGELKLDRQFVRHAHVNGDDGILVRSTIDMAHALGIRVVAEGVEDQACLDFLAESGCDHVQGWLIAKALPADEFLAFIEDARKAA